MDPVRLLSDVFGVTLVNAVGLLVFAFIGKTLFSKTIDAAAAKALEDKKNDFARELEEIRQRFARDLEAERAAFQLHLEAERRDAARALEEFKADLTFGAEIRRQVATRKVQALQEIVALCEPLARQVVYRRPSNDDDLTKSIEAVNAYILHIRQRQHLFKNEVAEKLYRYSTDLMEASKEWHSTHDLKVVEKVAVAYQDIMALVRRELGLDVDKS